MTAFLRVLRPQLHRRPAVMLSSGTRKQEPSHVGSSAASSSGAELTFRVKVVLIQHSRYCGRQETGTLARELIRRILLGCGIGFSCESGSDPKQKLVRRVPSFEAGIPSDSLLVCARDRPLEPRRPTTDASVCDSRHTWAPRRGSSSSVSPHHLFFGERDVAPTARL